MKLDSQFSFLTAFVCAWLFFLITRRSEIILVLKTESQRTDKENSEIENGLRRSLFFDALLFVPASVTLFLLTVLPFVSGHLSKISAKLEVWYGLMGTIAYGFPFLAVRQTVTKIALTTLLTTLEQLADASKKADE